jgi:hypothetical protein
MSVLATHDSAALALQPRAATYNWCIVAYVECRHSREVGLAPHAQYALARLQYSRQCDAAGTGPSVGAANTSKQHDAGPGSHARHLGRLRVDRLRRRVPTLRGWVAPLYVPAVRTGPDAAAPTWGYDQWSESRDGRPHCCPDRTGRTVFALSSVSRISLQCQSPRVEVPRAVVA